MVVAAVAVCPPGDDGGAGASFVNWDLLDCQMKMLKNAPQHLDDIPCYHYYSVHGGLLHYFGRRLQVSGCCFDGFFETPNLLTMMVRKQWMMVRKQWMLKWLRLTMPTMIMFYGYDKNEYLRCTGTADWFCAAVDL